MLLIYIYMWIRCCVDELLCCTSARCLDPDELAFFQTSDGDNLPLCFCNFAWPANANHVPGMAVYCQALESVDGGVRSVILPQ